MTAEQFTFWLQGYLDHGNPCYRGNPITLGEVETALIKRNLQSVFDSKPVERRILLTETPAWPDTTNPYTVTCTSNLGTDPIEKNKL
jgi:hypothetical protein